MSLETKQQARNTVGSFSDSIRLTFPREWRPVIIDAARRESISMTVWCRLAVRDALNAYLEKSGADYRVEDLPTD